LIVCGSLALCLAWLVVERVSGAVALERFLAELRKNGEGLEVDSLGPASRPDDTNNAFVALTARSSDIKAMLVGDDVFPPSGRTTGPGRAVAGQRLDRWLSIKKATNTWGEAGDLLERNARVLTGIHLALMRPSYDSGYQYQGGFNQPAFGEFRTIKVVVTVLNGAAIYELRQGHRDAALRHLMDAIRLPAQQQDERLVISQFTQQALLSMDFDAVWSALQEPGWTEPQLARLQTAWSGMDLITDMEKALAMDRARHLLYVEYLRSSPEALDTALGQMRTVHAFWNSPSIADRVADRLHPFQPLSWKFVWNEQDTLYYLQSTERLIQMCRLASHGGWGEIQRTANVHWEANLPDEDLMTGVGEAWINYRFPFSQGGKGLDEGGIRRTLMAQTRQQMVCAALACHRYQLNSGEWPENLTQLVPQFMATTPRDRIGGGELLYRRDPQRGFILYSRGLNGVDDGGDPRPENPAKSRPSFASGKDIVWPEAATTAEAEAFLMRAAN
jgi:hypothetical protein